MANSVAGDMDGGNAHNENSSLKESTDAQTQRPETRRGSEAEVVLNDQFNTGLKREEQTEALIQAAARDIIEKIEQDRKHGQRSSNSSRNENYEMESSCKVGLRATSSQDPELPQENGSDVGLDGGKRTNGTATPVSASEDDIFSHGRTPSGGSNNSSDALNTDEEARYKLTKEIAEEVERQQAANFSSQPSSDHEDQGFFDHSCDESESLTASRAPSYASTTIQGSAPQLLLNDQLNIPDFRSPSAMRALQMSSPAPSVFSGGSPMSRKRPTSSHLRTPQIASKKTGRVTPIFAKQEEALALLHCFVLPLKWPHGDLLENAPNDVLSEDLLAVKQAWKVLKDKLGDRVLERGVLIAHPQDSYETLDERLCGALELPRRPRAKILDCGHYLGPTNLIFDEDTDDSSSDFSDDEDSDEEFQTTEAEDTYCDVCCKNVRVGKYDKFNRVPRKKTFKVKIYAKNGLMGSGAWAACWRQIENVDVEIEPAVGPGFSMEISDLFDMALATRQQAESEQGPIPYEEEAEDESQPIVTEETPSAVIHQEPVTPAPTYQEATRPSTAVNVNQEPAYMEARSLEGPSLPALESVRILSPEPSAQPIVTLPVESKIRHLENEMRRIEEQEARHREIYGSEQKQAPPSRSESRQHYQEQQHQEQQYHPESRHSRDSSRVSNRSSARKQRSHVDEDSFVDLLLAAARVLLSDTKNLIIGFLGILVIVFALRSGASPDSMAVTGFAGVGAGGLSSPIQSKYETAFQRQEAAMRAAMQRSQMEDAARMRVEAEAMAQRPTTPYHGGRAVYEEDVQRAHPAIYAQQQQVAQGVSFQQVPTQKIVQEPAVQVAPVQHIVEGIKPLVPDIAPIVAPSDVVDDIREINIAESYVAANADFAIPTPPASIKDGGVVV